jgi:hypothetical protein
MRVELDAIMPSTFHKEKLFNAHQFSWWSITQTLIKKNLTMFQSSSYDSYHREIEDEFTRIIEAVHNGDKVAKAVSIQGERTPFRLLPKTPSREL